MQSAVSNQASVSITQLRVQGPYRTGNESKEEGGEEHEWVSEHLGSEEGSYLRLMDLCITQI